jgi:protein ImuB
MKRVVCIWLPNWPIQRLVMARPELKGRAVVLHARDPHRGLCVAACSAAARRGGVRLGMPLAEAAALLAPAPGGLQVAAHDRHGDRDALDRLVEWCERFSPFVGLETAAQRACLLLDAANVGVLFGGEETLMGEIATAFHRLGYVIRAAVADTIGAAWAAANFASHGATIVVPPGKQANVLQRLPVAALRLSQQTVQLLGQLGVFRVEQLCGLPRASLRSRFGEELLERWDQAAGVCQEVIAARRAPPEFRAQLYLDQPTDRRDIIELALAQLIEQVARSLAQRDRGAVRFECRLDGAPSQSLRMDIALFRPTAASENLLELARMQLEQLALRGPVDHVAVAVIDAAPLECRQGELFAAPAPEATRRLALLVDRLSSRLGRQCVVRPYLLADAQPERACCYVPLAGQQPPTARPFARRDLRPAAVTAPFGPADRPLQLRSPPLPLEAVSLAPNGPPICFRRLGAVVRIARHWGPERIETGWWRGPSVRRDYYRVETSDGKRFWLFRRLDDGKWFLHGEFV